MDNGAAYWNSFYISWIICINSGGQAMKRHKSKKILFIITLIALIFGLSACSSDTANDNSDEEDHGITLIPIFHSDGSTDMLFLPH